MSSSVRRAALLSAASFTVFAICLTLPGALLPVLVDAFHISLIDAGAVLACQPGAYLLAVLAAGRLLDRFGTAPVLTTSLLLMAAGIGGFGLASTWLLAGAALFVTGLGLGVMEVGVNTVLIDRGGDRRANLLNFAHLFFGVGAFITPLLATHAVSRGYSWRWPFAVGALLTALVGGTWYAVHERAEADVSQTTAVPTAPPPLDHSVAALLAAILGLYVGVETGVGSWLTKYLTTVRTFTLSAAGDVLSLYWLGLTGARLVLSLVAHHIREERLILALTLMATGALVASLWTESSRATTLAFGAMGIGLSGIFPAVIAVGGRVHPHAVARITSVLIAGAGAGGIVVPWLMSAIADRISISAGMWFYVGASGLMIGCALALSAVLSRPRTYDER